MEVLLTIDKALMNFILVIVIIIISNENRYQLIFIVPLSQLFQAHAVNIDRKNLGKNEKGVQGEARCECGHLIAKILGKNLELKCKRCRRIVTIPYSSIEGTERTIILQ